MKKLFIILLAVCLVAVGAIGYLGMKDPAAEPPAVAEPESLAAAPEAASAPVQEAQAEAEPIVLKTVDLEALYALHEPDEIVASVDGRDVTWGDYYYLLSNQILSMENSFASIAAYYGMELGWSDIAEGDDTTYAQIALSDVEDMLRLYATVEGFAEANQVTLGEESLAALEEQRQSDMKNIYALSGQDAEAAQQEELEEAFAAYMAEQYLSPALYERLTRINQLYQDGYTQLYGENGEKLSDEAALAWLNENSYVCANHILLATMDRATGEALDEAATREKQALAEELAKELQAIQDPEKLLARFAELKESYCEDSGKLTHPDGYTFTSGAMVAEFDAAAQALAEYEVSDPVETSYGYHVILRLPLNADAPLTGGNNEGMSARQVVSNAEYGQRLQDYMDALVLDYAEGFTAPDLLQYLTEAEG